MNAEFSKHDMARIELFEMLFPRMIYSGSAEEQDSFFYALKKDGKNLVHDMYESMCEQDKMQYPYKKNDFSVKTLERGGVGMIQINIPEQNEQINDVYRAYILYTNKGEDRKYFVIKRFCSTGNVFVFYIDAAGEGRLGDELTEHQGDMEYEYWKLVQAYAHLLVQDEEDKE